MGSPDAELRLFTWTDLPRVKQPETGYSNPAPLTDVLQSIHCYSWGDLMFVCTQGGDHVLNRCSFDQFWTEREQAKSELCPDM